MSAVGIIQKVLIAHRSEVALRVQTTCKALGIKTIAIYTQEDEHLSFVARADEAHKLSRSGLAGYLHQEEIITIALASQADAIHPGYGFLAENSQFAQRVVDAGLIWIGPQPSVIAAMGDKIKARQLVESLKVPTIPGFYVSSETVDVVADQLAREQWYPVLIKNPLSGGGKAMRSVGKSEDFFDTWEKLIVESQRMGLDASQLLIERLLDNTRHIEIQVAGDGIDAIHLYERECSTQRRYQKVIEETPCNFLTPQTLERMYACAVAITKAVGYVTVGTVEFIVLPDETFYFLEMNTRLQVEHAVTELTTGIDLVALQLRLACGDKVVLQQEIHRVRHAIECRIYAEDPTHNFMPSTGEISQVIMPDHLFIRHEHDLSPGMVVSSHYDPMLSKLVVFHESRDAAIRLMIDALKQFHVVGIKTNIAFLQTVLDSVAFQLGKMTTQSLHNPTFMKELLQQSSSSEDLSLHDVAVVAYSLYEQLLDREPEKQQYEQRSLWKEQQWL